MLLNSTLSLFTLPGQGGKVDGRVRKEAGERKERGHKRKERRGMKGEVRKRKKGEMRKEQREI
jgi:hypothetical protein